MAIKSKKTKITGVYKPDAPSPLEVIGSRAKKVFKAVMPKRKNRNAADLAGKVLQKLPKHKGAISEEELDKLRRGMKKRRPFKAKPISDGIGVGP